MQSYVMPQFPSWLLYGPTIIYSIGFWILALIREDPIGKQQFTWNNQKHYLKLAILTAANGLLFQFSAAWVNGAVAQVLSNLTVVQIPIFEAVLFPSRRKDYTKRQLASLLVVLIGIFVGAIHLIQTLSQSGSNSTQEQSNDWYWILAF